MSSAPPPSTGDYATATTTTTTTTARPWSEFLDTTSLSLPVSFSDATTRLTRNLTHFRVNYAAIIATVTFLSLILHPISLLLIAATFSAWFFLFFSRPSDIPFEIFGFTIDDRILVVSLCVITFLALIIANVWFNLLISIVISSIVVCLHGVLRVPSFADGDPYGGLLDPTSGAYTFKFYAPIKVDMSVEKPHQPSKLVCQKATMYVPINLFLCQKKSNCLLQLDQKLRLT